MKRFFETLRPSLKVIKVTFRKFILHYHSKYDLKNFTSSLKPHIYHVAARAYRCMREKIAIRLYWSVVNQGPKKRRVQNT
ncbi:hypothetical protein KUTeg_015302 [Tegillarca granosa]|uniref:Uncharacterized protein n=1 Tax=Tegillarca granosa TaxID=220873 RepID=A0ABQ9EPR3_TEGGR|nr:hypothetical protein KUTeg_015302 [Tegillarca granosa]